MRLTQACLMGGVTAIMIAACGGDSTAPSPPVDIAGTWQFAVSVSNNPIQISCSGTGTAVIAQSGSQANGTYSETSTCSGHGGVVQEEVTGTIGGGQINGNRVSFLDDAGCKYTGSAVGTPSNAMSGNTTCTGWIAGTTYLFTGTWSASR